MKGAKTGGRTKGTPNRVTTMRKEMGKEAIASLLQEYTSGDLMKQDFLALDPKDRIYLSEKLFSYIVPKMQATSVDLTTQDANEKALEYRLDELSEEI